MLSSIVPIIAILTSLAQLVQKIYVESSMIAGTSFREFICECMKFCKQTLHLNVKNLSEEWTYMSPTGGSLVELAYEGVSSKFSCFLILPRTNKALLVTSPHCAKKNNNGTLFKLLAGTC